MSLSAFATARRERFGVYVRHGTPSVHTIRSLLTNSTRSLRIQEAYSGHHMYRTVRAVRLAYDANSTKQTPLPQIFFAFPLDQNPVWSLRLSVSLVVYFGLNGFVGGGGGGCNGLYNFGRKLKNVKLI